jgi:septal ring factor EnvC (AmiA/AmiB activator)
MPKFAMLIFGLMLGINIGYVIMIPSRNSSMKLTRECIDSYAKSVQGCKESRQTLEKDLDDVEKMNNQCLQTLTECEQTLSLLQGRSR